MAEQQNETTLFGIEVVMLGRCPQCGTPIPVNALVGRVQCDECGWTDTIPAEQWADSLAEAMNQAPYLPPEQEGIGTAYGTSWQFELNWRRIDPYDPETKAKLDMALLSQAAEQGDLGLPAGGKVSVRPLPAEFAEHLVAVRFLVAEDLSRLVGAPKGMPSAQAEPSRKLHRYSCPGCGSPLEIDGSNRTVVCSYCGTSSVLPDELWRSLHPQAKATPWFLVLDVRKCPVDWDDIALKDAVADSQGRLYLLLSSYDRTKQDNILNLVCVGPDRNALWFRGGLELDPTQDEGPLLVLLTQDRLGVWTKGHASFEILSRNDGTKLETIVPSDDAAATGASVTGLDPRFIQYLTQAPDGTYLAWHREGPPPQDRYSSGVFRLRRFDAQGRPLPTWQEPSKQAQPGEESSPEPDHPEQDQKKGSWLSRLFGKKSQPKQPEPQQAQDHPEEQKPQFTLTQGTKPDLFEDDDILPLPGPGGDVFLVGTDYLGRYRGDGSEVFFTRLQVNRDFRRWAFASNNGTLLLPGYNPDNDMAVLAVDESGRISVAADSSENGGPVESTGFVTVADDGTIHLLGAEGEWTGVSVQGEVLFQIASPFQDSSD